MRILKKNLDTGTGDRFLFYKEIHDKYDVCVHDDGTVGIFKHAEVKDVLRDYANFSACSTGNILSPTWLDERCHRSDIIVSQDPPELDKNRNSIIPFFKNGITSALIPIMSETARKLVREYPSDKYCDFMEFFSYPFIARTLNAFYNTDFDFNRIRKWITALEKITAISPTNKAKADIETTIIEQRNYFLKIISERRKFQSNDFFSKLIMQKENSYSDQDLLNIAELLVSSGFHTTAHAFNQFITLLSEDKNLLNTLKNDNNLILDFVDELYRFYPSVHYTLRQTVSDYTLSCGYTIPAKTNIRVMIAAANRDPAVFENPNTFDIYRDNNNQSMAFGIGPHICLGKKLAIAETIEAVLAIVNAATSISILGNDCDRVALTSLQGYSKLDVKITK